MIPPRAIRKVLMTADSVGGVWTYALQLASELERHDVEVTLLLMGGKPSADQAREAGGLKNLSLLGTDLRLEWMADADADLQLAGELLLELEADLRPDVVHLNGVAHATLPFAAPVLSVAHSDVGTWWRACHGEALPPEWAGYSRRITAGIAAADMVVAPTQAYLRDVIALFGAPRSSRVIANGRDPARFAGVPKRDVVFAAGRLWDKAKNIAALCDAADGLSWPVLIAGEAVSPDGVSITLPSNVVPLGVLGADDIATRLAEAAVFASPARYEPFGLAILEAALSSCALVLGDIATLREVWGDAALFVDPDDADALRDTIEALLFDSERAATLGRQARRQALTYSSKRMGRDYMAAYQSLAASGRSRRAEREPLRAHA